MSLGQSMITTLFFVLVVMTVISANRMLTENIKSSLTTQAYDLAVAIAQDVLTEAYAPSKKFDQLATSPGTQATSAFTTNANLGPTTTERTDISPWPDVTPFKSKTKYDDFDDYQGYRRLVNTSIIDSFRVSVRVYYVNKSNPDVPVTSSTYFKRMDVLVSHPQYLLDSVKFSRVVVY